MGMRLSGRLTLVRLIFVLLALTLFSTTAPRSSAAVQDGLPVDLTYVFFPFIIGQETVDVSILPNSYAYSCPWGTLHIVGEVYNNSTHNLTSIIIDASLLNNQGNFLANNSARIYLNNLPAGQKTCFDITFFSPPQGWSSYQLGKPNFSTRGASPLALTVLSLSAAYDSIYGDYTIRGQVRNDQGRRVQNVMVVGTLYHHNGTVIGCSLTPVDGHHLNANATASFRLDFYGRNYSDVASFQVQVDGE